MQMIEEDSRWSINLNMNARSKHHPNAPISLVEHSQKASSQCVHKPQFRNMINNKHFRDTRQTERQKRRQLQRTLFQDTWPVSGPLQEHGHTKKRGTGQGQAGTHTTAVVVGCAPILMRAHGLSQMTHQVFSGTHCISTCLSSSGTSL